MKYLIFCLTIFSFFGKIYCSGKNTPSLPMSQFAAFGVSQASPRNIINNAMLIKYLNKKAKNFIDVNVLKNSFTDSSLLSMVNLFVSNYFTDHPEFDKCRLDYDLFERTFKKPHPLTYST